MLMMQRGGQRGTTLLELIITVAIVGILMAVGVPQLGDWVRRNSVASAAEIVQNGLRQAEAEAIRRNQRVEFLLTNDDPSKEKIKALSAAINGSNWASRVLGADFTPLSDVSMAYVNAFRMKDVSSDVALEGPANLVFTGTGRVLDIKGAAVSEYMVFRVTRPGADRVMCVFVTPGGGVRTCDPAISAGKPFACMPLVSTDKCPKL
ncbi:Tfp pilus assembly protein FimT/FimU [Zoogloea sp.]|jgi:type IV fimbrial biogenesis protein FimT|uniref:pilus assembly FimT family protein n=1 Tax=Zoogloea sp. TaxID=49181 RepID=UPI0035AE4EC0